MTAKKKIAPKEGNTLLKKLKSVCEKCSPASIQVYLRNIKRLYKLISEDSVPLTGSWLKKTKLFEEYKKLPLKTRRHLSTSAVKACRMYKISADKWSVNMYKDANLYERNRSKNKKSATETEKWPKKGFKSVKKAATEMMKRVRFLLQKEPNMSTLYKYQMALVLRLFTELPVRNTFATLRLSKGNHNHIDIPKKGVAQFVFNEHKASKKIGPKTLSLSRGATTFLKKFLKYRAQVVDNDFLLNNMKKGKMSRAALGKALHSTTGKLLGKKFGSRLIRVLAATAHKKELEVVQELGRKMLHSSGSKQTAQYSRKD